MNDLTIYKNDLAIYNSYEEIFDSYPQFKETVVETHINKLKELDKWFPVNDSFFMLINSSTKKYEYITKNFDNVLGLDRAKMEKYGLAYWFKHFKFGELAVGMKMLSELVKYSENKLTPENRTKMSCLWTHRIKRGDGSWINLSNNVTPIIFNENGKPLVSLAFYTKIGDGEKRAMRLTVRMLNEHNEYETVWQKNYTKEKLIEPLSNRERDVAFLLAQGLASKEIADKLFISSHTVDTHRRKILEKMSYQSTAEFIANFTKVLY